MKEQLENAKKKQKLGLKDGYVDCGFILASAAEIERVFSCAELILRKNRSKMSVDMFEVLLMLKVNSHLWGATEINEAMRQVKQALKAISVSQARLAANLALQYDT